MQKMISSTPSPCLVPVVSSSAAADEALEAEIGISASQFRMLVAYSACGRYLVASVFCDVMVFDSENRDCLKRLVFHKGEITAVKLSSSSKIISASSDHTVAVWAWATSDTPAVVLRGHTSPVNDISLSSDETKLFSASGDRTVKVWTLTGGEAINKIPLRSGAKHVHVYGNNIAISEYKGPHEINLGVFQMSPTYFKQSVLYTNRMVCTAVAFSKTGDYVALAYEDCRVEVQRTES